MAEDGKNRPTPAPKKPPAPSGPFLRPKAEQARLEASTASERDRTERERARIDKAKRRVADLFDNPPGALDRLQAEILAPDTVRVSDGDVNLAVRGGNEVYVITGAGGEWTNRSGPVRDLVELGRILAAL